MSSLWTPGGEHKVPRAADDGGAPPPPPTAEAGRVGDEAAEARAMAEEMRRLEQELVSTPAADVLANHCIGMFELAALHLRARPPQLDEARLAIDAFGAVVEGLGERLGESTATLRKALAEIRIAYVQVVGEQGGG